jgi:PPP family 3-phenylpropionic acid transporter
VAEPARLAVRTGGAFYAAYFGVLGVVMPFLGPYLDQRGVSAVWVGLITAAFSLAKLIYAPTVGRLVDRGLWFPGILTLHVGLALVVAFTVPWLDRSSALALAFLAVGVGYGTVLPLVEAAVLERLPATGYGALRLWGSVGFVAVAAASAVVLGGDRMDLFPLCVAITLVAVGLSSAPFERAGRPAVRRRGGALSTGVWMLLVVLTLQQVSHGPYYAFFSIHLTANGWGNTAVSALWSLGVAAELVAFLFGRRLEGALGLERLLHLALLLTPLRWLILALPPTGAVLALAQTGHAVTFAAVHLAGVQLVQRIVPAGSERRAQALYSGLTFGLGIVAGTALAGPLYATIGGRGSFLAAALFSCLVVLIWFPVRHRLAR